MRAPRGMSLIELVLVLAIMGVVAAVAVPRYDQSLARYRADAAARRLAADLALARAEAVRASAARSVTLDAATASYALSGVADVDRAAQPYRVSLVDAPYHADSLTLGLADGSSTVTFDGYGQASTGGTIVVAAGSHTRTLTIDAISGRASLP